MSAKEKGNTGQDNRTSVLDAVRGDPITLDSLSQLPDGYLRCVSADSYEEAVRVYGRQFARCWCFRNFYYFEEAE